MCVCVSKQTMLRLSIVKTLIEPLTVGCRTVEIDLIGGASQEHFGERGEIGQRTAAAVVVEHLLLLLLLVGRLGAVRFVDTPPFVANTRKILWRRQRNT